METSFVLTVGSDEYRLALPTAHVVEAEKALGESLLMASEHIDRAAVMAVVLAAAMKKFNNRMTLEKTMYLIDRIQEEGCSFGGATFEDFSAETRSKLFSMLLVISGFFTKEQAEKIRADIATSNPQNA